jgi:protein AFG1
MYLYGDVGTGKTMLMDLFYDTLPPHLHPHRRRVHFHAFMVDVFRRVHAIKHGLPRDTPGAGAARKFNPMEGKSDERAVGVERLTGGGLFEGFSSWGRNRGMDEEDAIYEAARELAEEGRILCFDEVGPAVRGFPRCVALTRLQFQVTDIVTAMILRQLLERMMAYGVVCVITSKYVLRPSPRTVPD